MRDVTVIVCTYNRAFILGECLDSLARQTAPAESFDVIIIDNNSADDTQAVAKSYSGRLPGSRIVFEPEQGLSHARNRGLAEARTEWIAFLDDDARACSGWVEAILSTIRRGDFDAFGGPYHAWHHFGPPPVWWPEHIGRYNPEQGYGPLVNAYIPGGNCAFRATAALRAGGFPVALGMSGKKIAYGEETFMLEKMAESGCLLGYVPDMKIDHCVLPYKYTLRWILKSYFKRGMASQAVASPTISYLPLRLGYVWLRALIKTAWMVLRHSNRPVKGILAAEMRRPLTLAGVFAARLVKKYGG